MENYINLIIISVVVIIVALAAFYVYKSKKKGKKCIGCPHSSTCPSKACCSKDNTKY